VVDTATGREGQITCAYLVAADGARSEVRRRLAIEMPDREIAASLNTAFFRADLLRHLPEAATHACFIRNEQVYCTLFRKGAGDQWSSHIMDYPGKPAQLTGLSRERTIHLLHAAIGDDSVPIDLLECNAWEAAIGIASAFRSGRVFLAGDAAHVQSSAGGLGMNTGIQDGHNLAWKIAAVLRGRAGEVLLDSYEPERAAAARASIAVSRSLHRGYQERQDTNRMYARLAADYLRGMMCYRYVSGAVLDADASEPDVLTDAAVTGCRLPHRWLDGAGSLSTLDLVGANWTLLTGPRGFGWRVAEQVGVPVRQLSTGMAGIEPDGALLVRPDHVVAWRSPTLPTAPGDTLSDVMRTLLRRGR
jgi:hypothetical protein